MIIEDKRLSSPIPADSTTTTAQIETKQLNNELNRKGGSVQGLMITLEYVSTLFRAERESLEKPLMLSFFSLGSLPPFTVKLLKRQKGKAVV